MLRHFDPEALFWYLDLDDDHVQRGFEYIDLPFELFPLHRAGYLIPQFRDHLVRLWNKLLVLALVDPSDGLIIYTIANAHFLGDVVLGYDLYACVPIGTIELILMRFPNADASSPLVDVILGDVDGVHLGCDLRQPFEQESPLYLPARLGLFDWLDDLGPDG